MIFSDIYLAEGVFSSALESSRVRLLTLKESFLPTFFLMATSKPLHGSKALVLQLPSFFLSQVSLSLRDQSSEKLLLSTPVSQHCRADFSLQI